MNAPLKQDPKVGPARLKSVLLMAYQISPSKGSEYSVGWNFALELAKRHKVYVLCGVSGDHMGDTREIEGYLRSNPHPNICLVPIRPTKLAYYLNWFNRIGLGPVFYLAFRIWHKEAYRVARDLVSKEEIDVVHQLGPIGFREPGYLWRLNKPYIWGPIGGALFVSPGLLSNLPLRNRLFFSIKNKITHFQLRYGKRIRHAARRSSELTFCSLENKLAFEKYLHVSGQIVPEQGSFKVPTVEDRERQEKGFPVNLVWAGRIAPQKNVEFLLHAVSLLADRSKWKLDLIGDGPQRRRLQRLAAELRISENIEWHGKRTRHDTIEIMKRSDLHVMTSLFEGNPSVLFEAISLGIPTISLDLGGMQNVLSNGNGILVPVTTHDETLKAYADRLSQAIGNLDHRKQLSQKTKSMVEMHSWEKKVSQFEALYDKAITEFHMKQN